jgi:anti-sigma factor RsiW
MEARPAVHHDVAAAWVRGTLNGPQREEFAAHLATCPDCQAEVAALTAQAAQATPGRALNLAQRHPTIIVVCVLLTLVAGYALGWWAWHLVHD